jgi:hypothetical protein
MNPTPHKTASNGSCVVDYPSRAVLLLAGNTGCRNRCYPLYSLEMLVKGHRHAQTK